MHYLLPLSLYQVESLRHQATHILSLRLYRAKPSLRREVEKYMLDVCFNVWNLKRGKVILERLLAAFSLLVRAWKWFDHICKWKNPISTMVVHFMYLFLVLFLHLVLILVFLICIIYGASQEKAKTFSSHGYQIVSH